VRTPLAALAPTQAAVYPPIRIHRERVGNSRVLFRYSLCVPTFPQEFTHDFSNSEWHEDLLYVTEVARRLLRPGQGYVKTWEQDA
jgi:hypothetical protein